MDITTLNRKIEDLEKKLLEEKSGQEIDKIKVNFILPFGGLLPLTSPFK